MAWINPFHQSLCPTCFDKFYLADCEVVSSIAIDPNTNEHVVIREAPTGFDRFIARFWIDPLAGSEYTKELGLNAELRGKE